MRRLPQVRGHLAPRLAAAADAGREEGMHSEGPGPGAKVRQAVARGRQAGVPGGLRGAGARRPGHGGPEEGPEEGTGAPPEQRPALARPSRPVVGGGCTSTAQEGDGVLPAAQGAVAAMPLNMAHTMHIAYRKLAYKSPLWALLKASICVFISEYKTDNLVPVPRNGMTKSIQIHVQSTQT